MHRLFLSISKVLVTVLFLSLPLAAQITISLDEANTYTAARIGINQGSQDFWESYQLKNLTASNPGFEAQMKDVLQDVSQDGVHTNRSFSSGNSWDSAPANFFAGGTFFVAYGANRGCSGTIASNTKANGKLGPGFTLTSACPHPFERGDVVFTRKVLFPTEDRELTFNDFGWDPVLSAGCSLKIDSRPADQFPGSDGKQALELINNGAPDASAAVRTPIDAGGILGYAFSGPYTQTIKARLLSGSGTLTLSGVRLNPGHTGIHWSQSFKPTGEWATYNAHFQGYETADTAPGPVEIYISFVGHGALLIDDSSLTSGLDKNPTVFRDQVIRDERLWDPGESRYWAGQNGESLANWIAPAFGRESSSAAAANYDSRNGMQIGLQDWLAKEAYEGVPQVWIEMPITWRYDRDASDMVDYLAGGAKTVFGRRRIELGEKQPWTSVFHRIVLEYGNEVWNGSAGGENIIPYSQKTAAGQVEARWPYVPMVIRFCAAMKADMHWDPAVMKCAAGIQTAGNSFWATTLEQQDKQHAVDLQANNEYGQLLVKNTEGSNQWISAWTEAWAAAYDKTNGFHKSFNAGGLQTGIYEYNNSTTPPSTLTAAQAAGYPNGEGYGLVDILMPLFNQKVFGIVDNDFFTFSQRERSFRNAQGQDVPLGEWGAVTGLGGRYTNPRPMFFAISMVNRCIGDGTGYAATVRGGPDYHFSGYNGVGPESHVPYLNAFAFKNGNQRCIVVVNTDLDRSYTFRFAGDHPPSGEVTARLYYSPKLTDTNETNEVVRLASAKAHDPGSFEIQPHSAMAISYQVSGQLSGPPLRPVAVDAQVRRPTPFPHGSINLLGDEQYTDEAVSFS